jgi:hypothetical protein
MREPLEGCGDPQCDCHIPSIPPSVPVAPTPSRSTRYDTLSDLMMLADEYGLDMPLELRFHESPPTANPLSRLNLRPATLEIYTNVTNAVDWCAVFGVETRGRGADGTWNVTPIEWRGWRIEISGYDQKVSPLPSAHPSAYSGLATVRRG